AQVPEATIKMETVAPDVVVASLETPEEVDDSQPVDEFTNDNADIDFTDTAEAFFQEKDKAEVSPADKTDSSQTNSNNIQPDKSLTKQSLQEDSKPSLNIENTDEKEDSKQNEQDVTQVQDSSQTSDRTVKSRTVKDENNADDTVEDSEDEEIKEKKEKKEAKLESYKQFVAEQFSNKKVDYPEVRVRIEANPLPSKMYFVMNILSAIIASFGLVTNSAAEVIGAMLVAIMLGPITGVALAMIDRRM